MLPLRRGDLLEVVLMLISIFMEATERAWLDFCNVVNVVFTNISILCGSRRQRFRGTSRRQRFKGTSRRQPFKGSLSISRESPILQQQPPTATLPQHRTNTTLFKASAHVEGQKDKLSVDEEWRQQRHQGQAIPLEGQQYMLDLTANTQKMGVYQVTVHRYFKYR
ncbi:hypothetical protein BC829DRAFT_163125 [Chytridium lagenaria]|nr:hypothetical protein BC829DRAFT_163125 [Chytridium lagenaria]